MVEDESQDVASEAAAGMPVNRDKRSDPPVIDGEVAARVTDEAPAQAAAPPPGSDAPPPSAPSERRSPGAMRSIAFGALGGVESTETLIAFRSFAKKDLGLLWDVGS